MIVLRICWYGKSTGKEISIIFFYLLPIFALVLVFHIFITRNFGVAVNNDLSIAEIAIVSANCKKRSFSRRF